MKRLQEQIAIFLKSEYQAPFENIGLEFQKKFGDPVNKQYIPVPNNAPAEFPRLILHYGFLRVQFTKIRADFFLQSEEEQHFETLLSMASLLGSQNGFEIGRIGYIKKEFHEAPLNILLGLIKDGGIDDRMNVKEVNLRINTPKRVLAYDCNDIESLNPVTATRQGDNKPHTGIMRERDVNTLAENIGTYTFTGEQVRSFVSAARTEAEKQLIKVEYGIPI